MSNATIYPEVTADEVRHSEEAHRQNLAHVNVNDVERWASGIGGTLLAVTGLKRGGLGGLALAAVGGALLYRGVTGQCHLYAALGIETAGGRSGKTGLDVHKGTLVKHTVTVNRPMEQLYDYWRDVTNLKTFMNHVESITPEGEDVSRWAVRGPMGKQLSWHSRIIVANPHHVIAWQSLPGGDVNNAGSVRFREAPAGRGTEVTLEVNYEPPAGAIGQAIAKWMGEDPAWYVVDHLQRFKQLMETGEIATNNHGQPRAS